MAAISPFKNEESVAINDFVGRNGFDDVLRLEFGVRDIMESLCLLFRGRKVLLLWLLDGDLDALVVEILKHVVN